MRLNDLLERKSKLKNEISSLGTQMKELGEELEKKDLATFLENGNLPPMDGHRIQKIKDRHKYLLTLATALDEQVVEAQRNERRKRVRKFEREANNLGLAREKIKSRVHHFQEKIRRLVSESQEIHQKEDALHTQAGLESRATMEVSLRLGKLEEFLKDNIIIDDEIEEKVNQARQHNREILKAPKEGDVIFRNFEIKWDRQTAKVLKFELNEQNALYALQNCDKKGSITKDELIREVC